MKCAFHPGEIIYLNSSSFVIENIIGRGSSCIVYRARRQGMPTEHLLKEYHPTGIELYRDSNKILHVKNKNDQNRFDDGLSRFIAGYQLQMCLRKKDSLKNSICDVHAIHEGYGTHFAEMTVFSGKSYDQVSEESLKDLLHRIKAITKIVAAIHREGYLLLDIKPDNIFTFSDNIDSIILFDFDSVVNLSNIPANWRPFSTPGWYAPELEKCKITECNGEKVDVYSIGMILYHKLTAYPPEHLSMQSGKPVLSLNCASGLLKDAEDCMIDLLTKILEYTLCTSNYRWTTGKLLKKLDDAICLIDRQKSAADAYTGSDPSVPVQVQVDVEVDNKVVVDHVKKQISKLHITILAAAILVCIPLFFLCCRFLLPDSETPSKNTVETYPSDHIQVLETTDAATELTANMQTETSPATITEAPTTMPMQQIEESAVPSMPDNENGKAYAIDTIAYTSENFRSLIVTNDGTVIYLDGSTIVNVNNSISADMKTDFGEPLENGYLAYDPYNDIVYLLAGGSLTIYNITNLSNPVLVADDFSIRLAYDSDIAEQIAVLPDGSLLVPADLDGTYRIDLAHKQVVSFTHLYKMQPPAFRKVIGNSIVEMYAEDTKAVVMPLTGGQEYRISLETEAPHDEARCANTIMDEIWFYRSGIGVCSINQYGKYSVVIDQKEIQINDYQTLDYTNIWAFATNSNGVVAFYDNSLKCIRCIKAAESNRLG